MKSSNELWKYLETQVQNAGYQLFDIDLPHKSTGTLRVYIARQEGHSGAISIDDCVAVSKALSSDAEFESFVAPDCTLEVSSPGINRRLRRREHYLGAIGERVRVKTRAVEGNNLDALGILRDVTEQGLVIEDERLKETVTVKLADIKEARIDFLF
ncbi:MAG: hypothetical protein D6719_11595 [Candidatus Dadabacteria bacterium]|nr:MAG: hypothetical protein D6719_11595 [Candidatus Dadabacteria bacterium]